MSTDSIKSKLINNQQSVTSWLFTALALAFQVVSFYSSFEGIKLMFVAESTLAAIFASALNLSLLLCWHVFQNHPIEETTDEGLAKRRSLLLMLGISLLALSAALSSVGMYSVLGFQSGSESDSNAENMSVLQAEKDIFAKVKDSAAKNLDSQKADLVKKLDAATKRLAFIKTEKRKFSATLEVNQIQGKINEIEKRQEKLANQKPNADEELSIKQRNAEIQTQIANLFSDFGLARETVLTAEERRVLATDEPLTRNLHDQLVSDLQNRKPLAIAAVVFGIAPDIFAVALMFAATPRKKLWRRIRGTKVWTVKLWQEILAEVELPMSTAVEIIVHDEQQNPLMQTAVAINLNEEVSDKHIRKYFPLIVEALQEQFERKFELQDLPLNWQEVLHTGEPLELTAVAV